MPAERYYLSEKFGVGEELFLVEDEFQHLTRVMRAKESEEIELVNGAGGLASAIIERLEKKRAVLKIEKVSTESPSSKKIILAQAIPRINRLDFIVEKGTELGMSELWLFPGKLSERKDLSEHQLNRLKAVTIASMKQCGRLFLPNILLKKPLDKWESLPSPAFFGDLNPQAPLLQSTKIPDQVIFFIGPESGFTDDEEKKLQTLGAQGVKLHPNILRTDTAALVALALLSQKKD